MVLTNSCISSNINIWSHLSSHGYMKKNWTQEQQWVTKLYNWVTWCTVDQRCFSLDLYCERWAHAACRACALCFDSDHLFKAVSSPFGFVCHWVTFTRYMKYINFLATWWIWVQNWLFLTLFWSPQTHEGNSYLFNNFTLCSPAVF